MLHERIWILRIFDCVEREVCYACTVEEYEYVHRGVACLSYGNDLQRSRRQEYEKPDCKHEQEYARGSQSAR